MFKNIVRDYLPPGWTRKNNRNGKDYKLVPLPSNSEQYHTLASRVDGRFSLGVCRIDRVENPYLYGEFRLKMEEYRTRGHVNVHELFHDTDASNVSSIVSSNLDWRLANRVKYGEGVSFSPNAGYANQQSCRSNSTNRAMIVADVLIQNQQHVDESCPLPGRGFDTTVGNNGNVYVKFYDNEFYPKFVVYYRSKPRSNRRR